MNLLQYEVFPSFLKISVTIQCHDSVPRFSVTLSTHLKLILDPEIDTSTSLKLILLPQINTRFVSYLIILSSSVKFISSPPLILARPLWISTFDFFLQVVWTISVWEIVLSEYLPLIFSFKLYEPSPSGKLWVWDVSEISPGDSSMLWKQNLFLILRKILLYKWYYLLYHLF